MQNNRVLSGPLLIPPGHFPVQKKFNPFPVLLILTLAVFGLLFTACETEDTEKEDPSKIQELLDSGIAALEDKNYDDAVSAFEKAYALDKNNQTSIVYSTLGKLASIAVDANVKSLMKDRLGIKNYPGTIDALITSDWMETYTDYEDTSKFPGIDVPAWFKDTNIYKENSTATTLNSAIIPYLMFASLIDKNTNGLNNLLDALLSSVFGTNFEAAYDRAATLSGDVKLEQKTLETFGLDEIFESEEIYIGKAELKALFAALRFYKAGLEWIASYDWNTDLNFLKNGSLWDEWSKLGTNKPASLPLRNNFLKDRNNGNMAKSKADYIKAIDDAIAAYDIWIGNDSKLPDAYKDTLNDYKWIKDGLSKLKTSINGGTTFYAKETTSGSTYDNTETDAIFGINMGKLFTPGQLSLNDLIETTGSGNSAAPVFYGYKNSDDSWSKITAKAQITNYDAIGFNLQTSAIKAVVVLGLGDIKESEKMQLFDTESAGYIWGWYNQ